MALVDGDVDTEAEDDGPPCAEPPHGVCNERERVATPSRAGDLIGGHRGKGQPSDGDGGQEAEFLGVIRKCLQCCFPEERESEQSSDGKHSEDNDVDYICNVGKLLETRKAVPNAESERSVVVCSSPPHLRQPRHDDAQDACVHRDDKPCVDIVSI